MNYNKMQILDCEDENISEVESSDSDDSQESDHKNGTSDSEW
jgi:hypothetical protein